MNIQELNAVNLMAIRHCATTQGVQKAAILFGVEVSIMEQLASASEDRIREAVEGINTPLITLAHNTSHQFWRDLTQPAPGVDWVKITRMRSLLSINGGA